LSIGKHGNRKEGTEDFLGPHWILKISTKNVVFLVSNEKKQISPLLDPLRKFLEKSSGVPLKIILPKPMVATRRSLKYVFVYNAKTGRLGACSRINTQKSARTFVVTFQNSFKTLTSGRKK